MTVEGFGGSSPAAAGKLQNDRETSAVVISAITFIPPCYNLRELQRLLMANPNCARRAHVTRGYVAFILELLGNSKELEQEVQAQEDHLDVFPGGKRA